MRLQVGKRLVSLQVGTTVGVIACSPFDYSVLQVAAWLVWLQVGKMVGILASSQNGRCFCK